MKDLDFRGLNEVIARDPLPLLEELLPGGKVMGSEYTCGTLQGGQGQSTKVNIKTGKHSDFATEEAGGDFIALYARAKNLSTGEAFKELSKQFAFQSGSNGKRPPKQKKEKIYNLGKPPPDAPLPNFIHYTYGHAVAHWPNLDPDTSLNFYAARYEPPGKKKKVLYWCWDLRRARWVCKHYPLPRPLFGLDDLARLPDVPGLGVEGEGTRAAAKEIFGDTMAVFTWPGGCKAWDKADFTPAYGRKLSLWPDNDSGGKEAVNGIAHKLAPHCPQIKIIDPSGMPKGWDLGDAFEEGWDLDQVKKWAKDRISVYQAPTTDTEADDVPDNYSEDTISADFSELHKNDLRYTPETGWHEWDKMRWKKVPDVTVMQIARLVCRMFSKRARNDPRISAQMKSRLPRILASAKTVAAVEKLARGAPQHFASVSEWDADPWKLNTPGGTVDLKTGTIHPHRQDDKITKIAGATPRGKCDLWEKFLNRVTKGRSDLKGYLRRLAGYSLVGTASEESLDFFYGPGANGKGTFLDTLLTTIAEYGATADTAVFMESNSDRHPTELARLAGVRLVSAQEVDEGRRWNESRLKALTGRDVINARFMRKDFFEYRPVFTLIISGNHRPALKTVDEAIRRRIHLVPFEVVIPAEERDPELKNKLTAELDGILAWAVKGCLEWQQEGLNPPECVIAATEDYLEQEDTLSQWISEMCLTGPEFDHAEASGLLYRSFREWKEVRGEGVPSQRKFTSALVDRGFTRGRKGKARLILGMCLNTNEANRLNLPKRYDGNDADPEF